MSKLKSSNIVPSLNLTFKFEYENGYVKTVSVREGQVCKNLKYTLNGEIKTVTGVIKLINFISKQGLSSKDGCFHDDVSEFTKYVSITSLNMDCSEQYNFNVVQVPVVYVLDIESVEDLPATPVNVNGVVYASITDAFANAETGSTVVLSDDFQSDVKLEIAADKNIVLDLHGNKLFVPEVENNYGCVVKGELTISGPGQVVAGGDYGVGVPPKGKLTIDGGKFNTIGTYLVGNWGETIINGGEFHGSYCCVNGFEGSVVINGGNFVATNAENNPEWGWTVVLGNVKITGGTFSHPIHERYCAEGYEPKENDDGTYTVKAIA